MSGPLESVFWPLGKPDIRKKETPARRGNIVEESHSAALSGESYEEASSALTSVETLVRFRESLQSLPLGRFYNIFEDITNLNKSSLTDTEKTEELARITEAAEEKASRFSPRVADLYQAILSKIGGNSYEPKFEMTREKISEMEENDDLHALISGNVSWDMKLNRIEKRLTGYLAGARAIDRRDGNVMADDLRAEREEQLKKAPSQPPERRNQSKPSMDEMERLKEGERSPAIWSIQPAYGGYYREQSFSTWDNARNTWVEDKYEYKKAELVGFCEQEDPKKGLINLTMNAEVSAGRWISLAIPYTHALHKIESGGRNYNVQQDQNGDMVAMIDGDGSVEISVILSPKSDKLYGPTDPKKIKTPEMPAKFADETEKTIDQIRQKKQGGIAQARALSAYAKRRLSY